MSAVTSQQSVVAVYNSITRAKDAVRMLRDGGLGSDNISFIARSVDDDEELREFVQHGQDRTQKDAAIGAGMGGFLGLLAGVTLFALPGGPILLLGPLAASLTGAIVGGLVGAMAGWGVPKKDVEEYEQHIRAGKYLVVVHGDPQSVALGENLLKATSYDKLKLHATAADTPVDD